MPHTINALPKLLTAFALAGWATGCDTEDDIDDRDRIAEDEELELADEELDVEESEEDEPGSAQARPDTLIDDDAATEAKGGGGSCTVSDSNGPLEGGTITVTGCEPPLVCVPYACGGYSCWGTCQSGGGIITPK
jgi:hypothetical protein